MLDQAIIEFDKALRTVFASAPTARTRPGADLPEAELSPAEKQHAAALMRINHVGEVCAQALYQGQALTSRDPATRAALVQAAWEETEHLNWTEKRIEELGGRKSFLNPLWYAGSLAMGIVAGKFGDTWNLGFLAETERQGGAHLTETTDNPARYAFNGSEGYVRARVLESNGAIAWVQPVAVPRPRPQVPGPRPQAPGPRPQAPGPRPQVPGP